MCLALTAAGSAQALINPTLQMDDLYERYVTVLSAKVLSIAENDQAATLAVDTVYKGQLGSDRITMVTAGDDPEALLANWEEGQKVVALVGKRMHRHENELIFYFGNRSNWQQGEIRDDGSWLWLPDDLGPESGPGFGLWGTWNGDVARLEEMLADLRDGTYYFPVHSFAVFDRPQALAQLEPGFKAVAAHDLNGDGRIDILGAAASGVKAFRQEGDGTFTDVTSDWALQDASGRSVSVASARGNGRGDLLLDDKLYFRTDNGYRAAGRVDPDLQPDALLSTGFVDADNDGLPDVLMSVRNGGLRLYVNRGKGKFKDATQEYGLDTEQAGSGKTGYVFPGDFNGDGRVDLYYAGDFGFLLIQQPNNLFAPLDTGLYPSFFGEGNPAETGAGQFTTCWRADRYDILAGSDIGFMDIVRRESGQIQNVTDAGNEFAEEIYRLLGGITEDFNADGTVDILGVTSSVNQGNVYLMNRGYGSYMRSEKYRRDLLPAELGNQGALGGVTCDIDADGDNDLILASADGALRLCRNLTWDSRSFTVSKTAVRHEQILAQTRAVCVRVTGDKGLVGAEIVLTDSGGRVRGRRWLGAEMFTGCRGPNSRTLAVRQPGKYSLKIRYSDGLEKKQTVDLTGQQHLVHVTVGR